MIKKASLIYITILLLVGCNKSSTTETNKSFETDQEGSTMAEMMDRFEEDPIPIQITYLQNRNYPGSELTIEETLSL